MEKRERNHPKQGTQTQGSPTDTPKQIVAISSTENPRVLGVHSGQARKNAGAGDCTNGAFEADLFAIVARGSPRRTQRARAREPESTSLVAAAAYAVSSVETCVKSGRKFHSRQDLVAVTHCALAALATSRDLLGLPAQEHLDKRNRIFGVVKPTARWLYGERASDDLIWKVCDVAIKGAQAGGANMRTVNNAFSEDFQGDVRNERANRNGFSSS